MRFIRPPNIVCRNLNKCCCAFVSDLRLGRPCDGLPWNVYRRFVHVLHDFEVETSPKPSRNFYRRGGQKVRFLALSLSESQLWAAVVSKQSDITAPFLPRCILCRTILARMKPSVRLSVCPSNEWIVTKRKKLLPKFLHYSSS